MPFLTAGAFTDFAVDTKARSAEVNANFAAIYKFLNTTTSDLLVGTVFEKFAQTTASFTISADATAVQGINVNTTAGYTVTLPTAAASAHRRLTIKHTGATLGALTIDGAGSETIDGQTTKILNRAYEAVSLQCDGSSWYKLAERLGPAVEVATDSDIVLTDASPRHIAFTGFSTSRNVDLPLLAGSGGGGTIVAGTIWILENQTSNLMAVRRAGGAGQDIGGGGADGNPPARIYEGIVVLRAKQTDWEVIYLYEKYNVNLVSNASGPFTSNTLTIVARFRRVMSVVYFFINATATATAQTASTNPVTWTAGSILNHHSPDMTTSAWISIGNAADLANPGRLIFDPNGSIRLHKDGTKALAWTSAVGVNVEPVAVTWKCGANA